MSIALTLGIKNLSFLFSFDFAFHSVDTLSFLHEKLVENMRQLET